MCLIYTSYAYNNGDVFAGIGHGKIKRFDQNGVLLQTLTSPINNSYTTSMVFDNMNNLYASKLDIDVV